MIGNIYIVSLALAQLLITLIALPGILIEIVLILPNNKEICHLQWLTTQFTLIILLLNFLLISIENLSALKTRSLINYHLFCSKFRIIFLVLLSWLIAGVIVYLQHKYQLAPAFCAHELENNLIWTQYHLLIAISIFLLPTLITMICFLRCALRVKRINAQLEINPLETPWQFVQADGELVKANIIVYLYTFFSWLPLCVLASLSVLRQINMNWLNGVWWLAVSNSCLYSFVYAFSNALFAKSFFKLFYYCCCKSHIQFEGKSNVNLRRQLTNSGGCTNSMELRPFQVHLIPGLNMNQRRDDHHFNLNNNCSNFKNQKYSNVNVGRHTRTIPASDGGLGFGGAASSHHGASGGFHKFDSRIDSDNYNNYSGNLLNRYASKRLFTR